MRSTSESYNSISGRSRRPLFSLPGAATAIVQKLHDATVAAMNIPTVQAQMKKIGADLVAPDRRSPEYLQEFLGSEIAKWSKTIKASGVVMD